MTILMKYTYMDKDEIQIAKLDNIISILACPIIGSSNSKNNIVSFEAKVEDKFGASTILSYDSTNPYFISFVKKIYEYYIAHKDEFIKMDEVNLVISSRDAKRKINDEALLYFSRINENLYQDKLGRVFENSYKQDYSPFGSISREIESLIPTLIVEIKSIFEYAKEDVIIEDNIRVYNENFVIRINRNGKNELIPVTYKHVDDETYIFSLGNIFKPGFVNLTIRYSLDKIDINWECLAKDLNSYKRLTFNESIKCSSELFKNGEPVSFSKEEYMETNIDDEDINKYFDYINEDKSKYKFFVLPSNEIYAVYYEEDEKDGIDLVSKRIIKFTRFNGRTHIRDSYIDLLKQDKIRIHNNGFIICSTLVKNQDEYFVETSFLDSSFTSGEYDATLNGKVIYRIIRGKDKEEIKNINEVNIQRLFLRGDN